MGRKNKGSKMNSVLTAMLAFFTCLFFFSIGVISGKGWSDREYKVRHIENDSHMKAAMEDNEPLGDEMSQKEVEMLTERALREAKAEEPSMEMESEEEVAESKLSEKTNKDKVADAGEASQDDAAEESADLKGREASTAQTTADSKSEAAMMAASKKASKKKMVRKVSSVMPAPSIPKPKKVEYTVQVAAYKSLREAEAHSQKLIDKGFPAFPVKAMIGGKLWYRVSIGSFKSRKQAMKYEKNLKKQAVVSSTFVQKITRLK